MAIYKTARFKVKPEGLTVSLQAIREFVTYVKENEPETQLYISLHEVGDETSFLHYFIFDNSAAEERHRVSTGVKKFVDILYPHTVDGVQFTDYQPVASTEG